MGSEWKTVRLSDIAQITSGKRPKIVSKVRTVDCQIPIYGGGGQSGFTSGSMYSTGVMVTGRVGTLGKLFAPHGDFWATDNTIVIIPASSYVDDIFLRYSLEPVIPYLATMNRGAANPLITQGDVGRLKVSLPPLPEQRAIARILGALDDRIEMNRRMNATLEAMAQALFKSWFVDFDPVVVNALRAGNPVPETFAARAAHYRENPDALGLPESLLRRFPDRFADSELGPIPAGWEVGKLGDRVQNVRRSVQPSEINPDTPYIALEHMPRRSIALSNWGSAEGLLSNKFEFRKNEILFGKLRPYFHKVGIAPVSGICSTDIVVMRPQQQNWLSFVLCCVSSNEFVGYTSAGATGTKMPRTNWKEMARYQIVIPPEAVVGRFNEQVFVWVNQIVANIRESRTLAALRDTLLPKLISGELRVPEVEKILEGLP